MSVSYAVDLDELDDVIGRLARYQQALESRLGALDAATAALQLHFSGIAAGAQRAAHERWAAGARESSEGLGRMVAAARSAHADYLGAAEANERMWRPLG